MLPSLSSGDANPAAAAILALADGTLFRGVSIGADGHCAAKIVFNTLLTGHQEVVTDPAYSGQIVAFTYPHIGSTGVNTEDAESASAQVSGLVVRDCPDRVSNFRAVQSLPEYLKQAGVVAISGVDTRKLTRLLRDNGSQGACILVGDDADRAIELARQADGETDTPPVVRGSVTQPTPWTEGSWQLGQGYATQSEPGKTHVVVYDYGTKRAALRCLVDRGCRVTLVPASTPAEHVLAMQPDGVLLSSGPGNPATRSDAVAHCKQLIDARVPLLGIGLGCQLMALASGAHTTPLKTGHHGGNHPVRHVDSGRVHISSQKHDYTIVAETLPDNIRVTHTSLFDGSVQGFELTQAPGLGIQAYPEASPGPGDLVHFFDKFISLMAAQN